jgi:hypothetical protein
MTPNRGLDRALDVLTPWSTATSLPPASPGPSLDGHPAWLDEFVRAADAGRLGLEAELRALVRHGELIPVGRGVARWRSAANAAAARGEHPRDDAYRALISASMIVGAPQAAVAGSSAALLWGMSALSPWPARAEHLMPAGHDAHSSRWVARRVSDAAPRTIVDGMPVTTPARTVVDIARTFRRPTAFSLAATALARPHRGRAITTADEVLAELDTLGPARGVRAARAIVGAVGTGCQSPAEAHSLMLRLDAGLERPAPQVEFRDAEGSMVVDAYWESARPVGECDGVSKYLREDRGDGRAAAEAVVAEKRREDRLRALGFRVVRWSKSTLRDARAFIALLRAAGVPDAGSEDPVVSFRAVTSVRARRVGRNWRVGPTGGPARQIGPTR